jgi:hypothetical protein
MYILPRGNDAVLYILQGIIRPLACGQVSGPGDWLPPDNVLPFPDCSVSALSSVISVPTDLRVNLVSSGRDQASLCDDAFFLKQVELDRTYSPVEGKKSPIR